MSDGVATAVAKFKRLRETKESGIGIRLDYSDTYFENESLDNNLNKRLTLLNKNKYRAGIERDESLKHIRKAAEDIAHLSNAIKKGAVASSVPLLKATNMEASSSDTGVDDLCTDLERVDTKRRTISTSNDVTDGRRSVSPPPEKQATSNLTMFALSYQKFAVVKAGSNFMNINQTDSGHSQTYYDRSPFSLRGVSAKTAPRAFPRFDRRPKLRRPLTTRHRTLKAGEVLEAADCMPVQVHAVHAHKSRKSKSRRELQEMSKLEQKEKFGQIERLQEKKNKMIAWAKGDDSHLDKRVKTFVKDCEQFTRPKTSLGIEFDVDSRSRNFVY